MHNSLVELEQHLASLQSFVKQLQSTDSISIIDKDLLQQKCLALYDQILNLPGGVAQKPLPDTTVSIPTNSPEEQPELESFPVAEVLLINDVPSVDEGKTAPTEIPNLFAELPKTETELQNEHIEERIEELKQLNEPPTPSAKEEVQELSLHEKIAHALPVKPDLSEKLSSGGITSLKSAINVNLKIAIVNDLFKENTVEYVKAIDKLNNADSIHEAMRYFTELKHTYDWDNESHLVKELETLINKRFQ